MASLNSNTVIAWVFFNPVLCSVPLPHGRKIIKNGPMAYIQVMCGKRMTFEFHGV